jgi:molybdopterin converting factor small subunit
MTVPESTATAGNHQADGTVPTSGSVSIELRYFAAARAALGRSAETLAVAPGTRVSDVVGLLTSATPEAAPVLARCAVLLDGRRIDDHDVRLHDGARLDLLPPFAGG